jgi:hypothetical protein
MIDKIPQRYQTLAPTKTDKVAKKQKTTPIQSNELRSDSLIEQIVSELKLDDKENIQEIQRELIVKTLTNVLGEDASSGPGFKKLVGQIENALSDSVIAHQKLNEIKERR